MNSGRDQSALVITDQKEEGKFCSLWSHSSASGAGCETVRRGNFASGRQEVVRFCMWIQIRTMRVTGAQCASFCFLVALSLITAFVAFGMLLRYAPLRACVYKHTIWQFFLALGYEWYFRNKRHRQQAMFALLQITSRRALNHADLSPCIISVVSIWEAETFMLKAHWSLT